MAFGGIYISVWILDPSQMLHALEVSKISNFEIKEERGKWGMEIRGRGREEGGGKCKAGGLVEEEEKEEE